MTTASILAETDWSLGDALITVLWIFLFVLWFWLIITIFGDLTRDKDLSGGAKAVWVIAIIFLPFIGILVYLIARGGSMASRAVEQQQQARADVDDYVRETRGGGTDAADQIAKAKALHDAGTISDEEFQALKDKALR